MSQSAEPAQVDLSRVRPTGRPGRTLLIVGLMVAVVGPVIGLIALRTVAGGAGDRFQGAVQVPGGGVHQVELAAQTTYALAASGAAGFACSISSADGQVLAVSRSGALAGLMNQYEVTTTVAGPYSVRCDPTTPGASITVLITAGDGLVGFAATLLWLTIATVGLFVLGGLLVLIASIRLFQARRRRAVE
ncbi:MAG: hypothetical protein LBJ44_11565 [Propionibacteriaceae bacterium]|jgi:hypothetical protein|nr:hypothetical protein [Propionibacteriaceae bacterium]